MLVVQKYGGSSLADSEKVLAAARRVIKEAGHGVQVVVVVSAQADTTDHLIEAAHGINPQATAKQMDTYLAAGEQLSAALMAMAIESLGLPAVSLTGAQAGICTDEEHGNARITTVCTQRICQELEAGNIVVVAGFQGISPTGNITTLGRGGSDTTAVALAAYLHADRCQIFTDVDGVYDADPRKFPGAVRFEKLGYDQMLQLIADGAQVLHDRSVELAKQYAVEVEVRSSFTDMPGTVVGPM